MLVTCPKCGWRVDGSRPTCIRCTATLPTPDEFRARALDEQARQIAPELTDEQRQRIIQEERLHQQEERLRRYLREGPDTAGSSALGEDSEGARWLGQPLWVLGALNIVTFCLYFFYWYYRTCKHLRDHTGKQLSPGWRTVGLLVPILGWVLVWKLFDDIHEVRALRGVPNQRNGRWRLGCMPDPFILVVLVILGSVLGGVAWELPPPPSLVDLLVQLLAVSALLVPQLLAQAALNDLWLAVQPRRVVRSRPSASEIVVLCLGLVWLSLVALGRLFPE